MSGEHGPNFPLCLITNEKKKFSSIAFLVVRKKTRQRRTSNHAREKHKMYYSSDWTDFEAENWQSPFTSAPKTIWSFQRRQFCIPLPPELGGKKGKINVWKQKVSHRAFEGMGRWRSGKTGQHCTAAGSQPNFTACYLIQSLREFMLLACCPNWTGKKKIFKVLSLPLILFTLKSLSHI